MKVLQIHNYYRSNLPSGENEVVRAENKLLKNAGHIVHEYSRSNDEWNDNKFNTGIQASLGTIWNNKVYKDVSKRIGEIDPDIIHLHNTFPLLSPSAVVAASHSKAACVMTLHNYRLFCSNAVITRNGKPCIECIENNSVLPALKHACYRNSRLLTIPIASGLKLHQALHTWPKSLDSFIVMTSFQRDMMIKAGLPANAIHIKPHSAIDRGTPVPWDQRENRVVFIGRLSEEKGLHVLLDAWITMGPKAPRIDIIGEGPLKAEIKMRIKANRLQNKIRLIGALKHDEAIAYLAGSKLLVMPSVWDETFGLPIIEAFSSGVPVIASDRAHFPEMMSTTNGGCTYPSQDSNKLASLVMSLWDREIELRSYSMNGRLGFENHFSARPVLESLLSIYKNAINYKSNKFALK